MIVALERSNATVFRPVSLAARADEVSERYLHCSNHGILTIIAQFVHTPQLFRATLIRV
jgi:hypothetical protein